MSNAYFSGPCKWARLITPDEKYNKYSISVGLDTKQYMELQKLKVKNAGKLDENGLFWVNFHRKADLKGPAVVDADGNPVKDLVGNDSEVTVKVEIKSWTNKETKSLQYACVMDTVRVDKLVIYDPNKKPEEKPVAATTQGHATPPATSLPTPTKRLF